MGFEPTKFGLEFQRAIHCTTGTQRGGQSDAKELRRPYPARYLSPKYVACKEIGSRVGRNKTTVMGIWDLWMQESTTDRRGRSQPPQCTTSREDRHIVRMGVTIRSVTSRTIALHIESVTHHSVSARTIRRHLQQSGLSARLPLLGLPLTQSHRRLRRQWCDEKAMWAAEWNEIVFTDESRI
ncbi:transposable element Tcb1 transposase [Trichonephila clavipes]|nr:transposable element Tcb1 transposase [Trichonephila clavipes]